MTPLAEGYQLRLTGALSQWAPQHARQSKIAKARTTAPLFLQDPFGNYVVQYVLELGDSSASGAVMRGLAGHWPDLAQQKFSSNVVEKCLKLPGLAATQVLTLLRCSALA
jgi:Pumilio-family RNA binding repeat